VIKKYPLDLTEAKLPKWWPADYPLKIHVQDGRHQKELDLAPAEMEKPWAKRHFIGHGGNPDLPIGFDRSSMPQGAKLVELP
jgi:hypothetical protein